jgi:8-oxo-dGTP diphosphatase
MKQVAVAAAVIEREDGRFLLGQRAPGTFYPGYWEFPGGKVEAGETPHDALVRELDEELGLTVTRADPWIVREHVYEHAHVRLHFFRVRGWHGEVRDHVHSALAWQHADRLDVSPMLPANAPVLRALDLPTFMAVSHAAALGVAQQISAADRLMHDTRCLLQLREPDLAEEALLALGRELVRRAPPGCPVVINRRADLVAATGAMGLHLPATALMSLTARPGLPLVGASCHSRAELERAGDLQLDYAVLGPVQPTATHPGEAPLGWQRFAELVQGTPIPVFAIGGLGRDDLDTAWRHGAHGVAAIRGAWRSV